MAGQRHVLRSKFRILLHFLQLQQVLAPTVYQRMERRTASGGRAPAARFSQNFLYNFSPRSHTWFNSVLNLWSLQSRGYQVVKVGSLDVFEESLFAGGSLAQHHSGGRHQTWSQISEDSILLNRSYFWTMLNAVNWCKAQSSVVKWVSFLVATSPPVWIRPVFQRVNKPFPQSSICNIIVGWINHDQASANPNLTRGGRPRGKGVPCWAWPDLPAPVFVYWAGLGMEEDSLSHPVISCANVENGASLDDEA